MPDSKNHVTLITLVALAVFIVGCASLRLLKSDREPASAEVARLTIRQDEQAGTISVFRMGRSEPILTQNARPDQRPFLHPLTPPDGKGVLTENSPAHHKHQTGFYWGFTRLNGRDYFHNPQGDYWRRVSASVLSAKEDEKTNDVRWQIVYDLLDEAGSALLTETQRWTMRERDASFVLDLEWRGAAKTDLTVGQDDYGGLFLRTPWREGIAGEVVNAARQRNARAEGQRAMWIDVGMQVEGRDDLAHIAIFDHPDNIGYPQAWRVDAQLGVGSARSRTGDWTIRKGETEVIRHQLVIYSGKLDDVALTSAWTEFGGNRSTYSTAALWSIAQSEGRAAKFLAPDQAVAQMTVMDGFTVDAWAAEPMLTQPMAFCWDDRGRLWVAENRDYESRVSGFSNAGDSRIVILEDTDRDGKADSRKVFLEGIVFPAAIAVGFDGVFVGAPPNLLFVPDRNGDDKADMADIEVRLTGWGIADRHETLNSLHWGPDGWLYGLQGYATASKVRKPSGKGRLYKPKERFPDDLLTGAGVDINGGVWRYHPTKDLFEVVAHGFSNPWGIDYDAKGQLLISACVIPHLWHVIPGGIYHRQGGQHFNPYVYSDIKTIADHSHRSAHGGARVYQSDAFPASQQGRIFMANIHEHAVLSDVLVRRGSGFSAHHGDDFLIANNAQWIGFSLEIGPDGALYVLDWHDGDICGQDVLHQETGRIFRIAPAQSLAEQWDSRYADLRTLTDAQLVDLQMSRSDWHARRSRVILQHRAAQGRLQKDTHDTLRRLFSTHPNPDWRLRAMWALHVTGGWTRDALVEVLGDRDEHIRAWAVQLLCEDRSPPPAAIERFTRMAREDPSPVVRLYLASALQRLDHGIRWAIAEALMMHAEDADDHNLPKMLWLGVEPLVNENPAVALDRAGRSRIPLVTRFIARRAADSDAANALELLVAAIARTPTPRGAERGGGVPASDELGGVQGAPPFKRGAERGDGPPASDGLGVQGSPPFKGDMQVHLLEGMRDGIDGRVDLPPPSNWSAVYERLKRSGDPVARLADDVARQFDDTNTARRNLATLRSRTTPVEQRRKALQTLAAQRRPQLVAELPAVLDDRPLRIDGIRAIAAFDSDPLGKLLIERYRTFSSAEKSEAVQTLASRGRYGRLLTDALAADVVPKGDVPPHVARQLRRVVGTRFAEVWGPLERSATEERAYARYRGLLNDTMMARANARDGRAVFQRTCGACHKMYGEGGSIGPDLTGSNRANLDYLLVNVLEPNAEVQDTYKMVVITTRDGRTYSGNVVAETDRQVTLRVVGRDAAVINKSDIQSREATNVSMMPPGLFASLTDTEVIDLVAYLRTVEQVKAP
jgi:putative membrane-bound dehydrogenase-like protein